ncbi:MAG: UvrD-helicase domain-containing protein [Bacilli bacterium]|nr:UvrD-helicase domain-containing protein [Bacilli bacterium]
MYTSKLELKKILDNKKYRFFNYEKRLYKKINIQNKIYLEKKEKEYKKILDNVNGYSLDSIQREIVLSEEDSILVIAAAGSGKSLTILGRILYLVNSGVNPEDILCISFTNMASNSLKKSLLKCGVNMDVLTFHKLGLNILRSNGFSTNLVGENTLNNIILDVLNKYDVLDILPEYNFIDIGSGSFNTLHRLLSLETKEIEYLKNLIRTFINLFKGCNYKLNKFDEFLRENEKETDMFKKHRNRKLLIIIKEIYDKYTYILNKNKSIDFHDMISKAIDVVEKCGIKNYKYIIVDEYQDTSLVKCELLRVIKEKTNSKIMAVGDDFQSIYQFTGSDLGVFLNFDRFFPYTKTFKLEKTYRNSLELLDIMGKFILKNKTQIKKRLISDKSTKNPIYIYYYDKNINEVLGMVKKDIDGDLLVLGRNNYDIKNLKYSNCITVHKSKGLEADNVLIVNLEDSINGFPNKIVDDDLLKFVKLNYDNYPYAEERRLFYVAMTRTKNSNYLLVNKKRPSMFVEELLLENKNIKIMNDIFYCPKCGNVLIGRNGKYGRFYGCKNYPKCTYTKKKS